MGQGEEIKTRDEPTVEIQERGEIFFFYRPKVNKEEAHSPDDVQRLYIVLRPESGEKSVEEKQSSDSGKEGAKKLEAGGDGHLDEAENSGNSKSEDVDDVVEEKQHSKKQKVEEKESSDSGKKEGADSDDGGSSGSRNDKGSEGGHGSQEVNIEKEPLLRFIVMGRKNLPDPSKRSRPYWGFVELVTTNIDDVKTALKGEEYDTATRGHRKNFPARALAEGVYRILRHNPSGKKNHTHLIYKLEFPPEDAENEPQESLNIEREASFLIQIKNPDQGGGGRNARFAGLQNKRKAAFPAHLQAQFGKLRFSAADPPDYLNYEGCEFLLISASDDIDEELGLELKTEGEEGSTSQGDEDVSACSDLVRTFGETASTKPLMKGTWV